MSHFDHMKSTGFRICSLPGYWNGSIYILLRLGEFRCKWVSQGGHWVLASNAEHQILIHEIFVKSHRKPHSYVTSVQPTILINSFFGFLFIFIVTLKKTDGWFSSWKTLSALPQIQIVTAMFFQVLACRNRSQWWNLFQSVRGTSADQKKQWKMFVVWIGNCDIPTKMAKQF